MYALMVVPVRRRLLPITLVLLTVLALGGAAALPIKTDAQKPNPQSVRALVEVYSEFPESGFKPFIGDSTAQKILVDMLSRKEDRRWWPNVVTAVGYVSPVDAALSNRLWNYLLSSRPFRECPETAPEEFLRGEPVRLLDRADYVPKVNVIFALAYMARNGGPDHSARTHICGLLADGKGRGYWNDERLKWTAREHYMSTTKRADRFARYCESALKIAGSKPLEPVAGLDLKNP